MAFSDFAAAETALFVDRLLKQRSQESLPAFVAFREALDEVTRTVEKWARIDAAGDATDLGKRLAVEAANEARGEAARGLEEARATIESMQARVKALESQAAERDARFQSIEEQRRSGAHQVTALTTQLAAQK